MWAGGAAAAVIFLGLLPPAIDELSLKWNSGRELDTILDRVSDEDLIEPGSQVASGDNWQRSAILCFRLDCTYLGQPLESSGAGQQAELRASGIDHYRLWDDTPEAPPGTRLVGGPTRPGACACSRSSTPAAETHGPRRSLTAGRPRRP
ncbi:hypothetical protein BH23ACT2_BH23ACT2_15960 [soil metagenome]